MTVTELAELSTAILTSLGGGGAIVFGLSNYLGKVWAERGLEEQRFAYSKLMEQSKHEYDLATRRIQIELDAVGHLHKLRTGEEFDKVRQLWKHLARLATELVSLPSSLRFTFIPLDQAEAEKNRVKFAERCDEVRAFLLEEALSIPEDIKNSADEAVKIAFDQVFEMSRSRKYLPKGEPSLEEETSKNQTAYIAKLDQILTLMRQFQGGESGRPKQHTDTTESDTSVNK